MELLSPLPCLPPPLTRTHTHTDVGAHTQMAPALCASATPFFPSLPLSCCGASTLRGAAHRCNAQTTTTQKSTNNSDQRAHTQRCSCTFAEQLGVSLKRRGSSPPEGPCPLAIDAPPPTHTSTHRLPPSCSPNPPHTASEPSHFTPLHCPVSLSYCVCVCVCTHHPEYVIRLLATMRIYRRPPPPFYHCLPPCACGPSPSSHFANQHTHVHAPVCRVLALVCVCVCVCC